jgi:dihydrofolate reductase
MFARSRRRINDAHAPFLPKIDPAFGKSTLFFDRRDQERRVPSWPPPTHVAPDGTCRSRPTRFVVQMSPLNFRTRETLVRKLIASTMVSLDGVMQAPGGPEEDPAGGFVLGGWSFPFWDDDPDRDMRGLDGKDRELLLGRRTYEIFEAYWPYQSADNPIAQTLNAAKKHVASRTLGGPLQWNHSTLLRGDAVAAVAALKQEAGLDLQIIGSGNLIQALQAASLIDEYNVWTFPVVLGRGKRLFEAGAKAGALRLAATRASTTGVVMSTYVPAGDIPAGSFVQDEPSAKEVARRARWAREAG